MAIYYINKPGFNLEALLEKATRTNKPVRISDGKNVCVIVSEKLWLSMQNVKCEPIKNKPNSSAT